MVFGAGGLGTYAIQIARGHGARVAVVDISDDKLDHARHIGADHTIRADRDVASEIHALAAQTPVSTSLQSPQAGAR